MENLLPILAVSLVLPLLCRLFCKLIPYQPAAGEPLTAERIEELHHKYRWVFLVGGVFTLVVASLLTWLWTWALIRFADWRLAGLPASRYLIKPSWIVWMLPGLFLGLASSALPGDLLLRLSLRDRYSEFMRFERGRLGFDAKKVGVGLAVAIGSFSVAFVALASNWYIRVTDDYLAWKRFWDRAERRYSYAEVDRLVETTNLRAPAGNVLEEKQRCILFTDGSTWSDNDMAAYRSPDSEAMWQFLEQRTGKRIIHTRLLEDALSSP